MSQKERDFILNWYQRGIAAVDPVKVTRAALTDIDPGAGKLVVLAVGKAAVAMASAARDVFGNRIDAGLIVAKQGQLSEDVEGFVAIEAAHPVPDQHSLRAGETALHMVSDLSDKDSVIALISGGGSALLECPAEGISLMDMQITTQLMMYAGAGIYELNAVRKALSAIKGGGLRRAIGDARCITLMLSDVLGNDHTIIASGPTIPGPSNRGQAWQAIVDLHVQDQVPDSVRQFLNSDIPPAPAIGIERDIRRVIADNQTFVEAISAAAESHGLRVGHCWLNWRDEAGELARNIVRDCRQADASIVVLIGGGEAISAVRGDGLGGRNTETALIAALELSKDDAWVIASLSSDGDDGNSGAAGGIVDANTIDQRAIAEAALSISDSAGYLEQRDALIVTGQSGTNVNDVYIAVRKPVAGDPA